MWNVPFQIIKNIKEMLNLMGELESLRFTIIHG